MKISRLAWLFDVRPLKRQLDEHPEVWNVHSARRAGYGPHSKLSDVWVRYNAIENLGSDREAFNGPHESVWYPEAAKIPAARELAFAMMARVNGERLGGVLITKIPGGCNCEPHVDRGWHATYYDKFAISIAANQLQAFNFEGEELVTAPGDSFTFDNSFTHWVTNPSPEDRITLIICIRADRARRI